MSEGFSNTEMSDSSALRDRDPIPHGRDSSKATPLQKGLLVCSLAALFLVAVGAEEPAESSCCPEDECQITFNPNSLTMGIDQVRSIELRVVCDGEERQAEWSVASFDKTLLKSAVINNLLCGQGKNPP